MTAFLIADTFTDSLARLNGDEQKAVKTTAFDLQMTPASPGLSFHKLDKARDKNFWSVRVNADIRIIVHRSDHSLLLCYVDHHDKAYYWAERRKLKTHPKTGAAQLVEIREVNRTGFLGDLIAWEDGVYGTSKSVFSGSARTCRPDGRGAPGGRGVRHLDVGGLVQHTTTVGAARGHSTSRVRGAVL